MAAIAEWNRCLEHKHNLLGETRRCHSIKAGSHQGLMHHGIAETAKHKCFMNRGETMQDENTVELSKTAVLWASHFI